MAGRRFLLALALALTLGVVGCRGDAEEDIRANVTLLRNHEGALAMAAAEQLGRQGKRAIVTIESALHTASAPGRRNLVYALRQIGDEEAIPLLAHIAVQDRSELVRKEAEWTLRLWAADHARQRRADKAQKALRQVEEERGLELPG